MMKKSILIAVASTIAILSSCVKESFEVNDNVNYPVFKGTMENVTHADTKAGLDLNELKIAWNKGDEIFITDGSGKAIYQAKESGSGVTFEYKSGDALAVGDDVNYVAYYPASMVQEDGSLELKLKQPYVSENISYLPMKAESAGKLDLNFKNLTGIIRLKYTPTSNTYPITHIGFTANRPLSGNYSIVHGKAVTEAETTYQGVVLDGFKVDFVANEARYFYLAVPEGSYENFTINFCNENRAIFLGARKAINIYRSQITTIEYSGASLDQNQAKSESLNNTSWTNTTDDVPSNCYMVSKFSSAKVPCIPTTKGKTKTYIYGGVAAEVLWETDYTSAPVARGSILRAVQCSGSRIYLQFPSSPKSGSAVVALRNEDGEILWSWHIWVTPEGEPGTVQYTMKDGTDLCYMMDRNLGANGNSKDDNQIQTYGFYYQYGRKDPFVCPSIAVTGVQRTSVFNSSTQYSLADGIKNPTTYYGVESNYWAADITSFKDESNPCPQGYTVPVMSSTGTPWASSDLFTFGTESSATLSAWDECGWNYLVNNQTENNTTWFPASGYLSYKGGLTNAESRTYFWGASKYAYFRNTGAGNVNRTFNDEDGSKAYVIRCVKK